MDVEIKSNIIEEFMRDYSLRQDFVDDAAVIKFVQYYNFGIPLAQGVAYGLCTLTDSGVALLEETWVAFCELFDVKPDAEFDDFDDIMISGSED